MTMTDTREQVRELTKIDQRIIRIAATDKIAGLGQRIRVDDVEPDGRKAKKVMWNLVDLGKVVEVEATAGLPGPAYEVTDQLYDEIVAKAPEDSWNDEYRSVGYPLTAMSVYNLKWIAEHRHQYVVCYVKDVFHMLQDEYFEVAEPVAGAARAQEKAYGKFHHENPYDLRLVAVPRQLLAAKKDKNRDATIRAMMSHNVVGFLAEQGHIAEDEKDEVIRKSSGGRPFGEAHEGLSSNPDTWEQDVQAVIYKCAEKIAKLTRRAQLFNKLAGIDWKSLRGKLEDGCTKLVDEE